MSNQRIVMWNKLALVVLLVLVSVATIVACTPSANATPEVTPSTRYTLSSVVVYEFRLKDGTRCVTQYEGGLDCEWKRERGER